MALAMLFSLGVAVAVASTQVVPVGSYAYDAIAPSRLEVHRIAPLELEQPLFSESQEDSISPATSARATSMSSSAPVIATNTAADTTRVGRWMSQGEFDTMSSTGKVVEGAGGRTYVVEPPNPGAYRATGPGSVYAEFDVPSSSLRPAGDPAHAVIPGPNVTTKLYGPPPAEMPNATCIVWVCRR
jgi:hypothetical protein